MKKSTFITIFVSTHIVFIFMHIHKYSQVVKATYLKQKNELALASLKQKKQELTHQWCALHNRSKILQFAHNAKMEPITLNQIKKLKTHEPQRSL